MPDLNDSAAAYGTAGVAQLLELPACFDPKWAATVVINPPGRPVVVDAMDCIAWSAEAVHVLALRLAGRAVEIVMASPALAFWLEADLTAVRGWAA